MDYKEKYEQALERARQFSKKPYLEDSAGIVEYIFPELAESEDERIRKALVEMVHDTTGDSLWIDYNVHKEDALAWLEKQSTEPKWCHHKVDLSDCSEEYRKAYYDGWNNCNMHEQKPVEWSKEDKLKMDTLVHIITKQKGSAIFEGFLPEELIGWLWSFKGRVTPQQKQGEQKPDNKVESKFHKGDWITNGIDFTFQVCSIEDNMYLRSDDYFIDIETADKTFRLWTIQDAKDGDVLSWDDSKCIALFKNIYDKDSFKSHGLVGHCTGTFEPRQAYHDIEGAHPATKEQRDLLFQKINEAGYEWDAEKKELKKIEDKPLVIDEGKAEMDRNFTEMMLKDYTKQKPAWSEEDKEKLNRIYMLLPQCVDCHPRIIGDRECVELQDWLKSLRPQTTWKPSDEQMEYLSKAILTLGNEGDNRTSAILYELRTDLKKLKG